MFNCFKCKLIPPKKFITENIFSSEYKNEIWVDACLAEEISDLWSKGIRTLGCCCGHGIERGTIWVHDCDAWRMIELGYEEESYGIYYAKSDKHYYFGESEFYNG